MGAIRSGGIVSGLDTNAIIESLVTSAKQPITALENKSHLISLQQTLFKDINSDFTSIKSILFNLKLESTFKSKATSLSNASIANVTASPSAAPGTYTIDVLQKATQASQTGYLCKAGMVRAGAGVNTSSPLGELPRKYNQQECDVKTTIQNNSGTWTAVSEFSPLNSSTSYQKQKFTNDIGTVGTLLADSTGKITSGVLSAGTTMNFTFSHAGGTVNISVDPAECFVGALGNDVFANVKDINHVMSALEEGINNKLNEEFGTTDIQYVAFMAEYDDSTNPGTWSTVMYDVSDKGLKIDSATGHLAQQLGLDTPEASTSTVNKMYKYHVADSSSGLQEKLNSVFSSVVYGAQINFTALTTGTFEMRLDTTMSVKKATPTIRQGTSVNSGTIGINDSVKTSLGLSDSEFKTFMGKFTINGKTIDLGEYSDISINALMGMINSSGAGVVMTFDTTDNTFKIASSQNGATAIKLGGTNDTSNIFDLFCLTDAKGSTTTYGSSEGSLNTTSKISEAGFTIPPGSGVFTINGVPIYVDKDYDTVDDLIKKVNNSGAGVTLSYDSARDKFVILSNNSTDKIQFGSPTDTSNFLYIAGFTGSPSKTQAMGNEGTEAVVVIDGQEYHRKTNTIEDVIGGLSITLASVGTTTVTVSVDTDKAITQLANFVKAYNSIMTKLRYSEISENDRKEYMNPLTDEDKANMSDDEIAKYETRYDQYQTQSIINTNSALKSVYRMTRENIMSLLSNNSSGFHNMTAIGIDIAGEGDWTVSQKGLLVTDSTDMDEIKEALLQNDTLLNNLRNKSEDVYKFFGGYEERSETDAEYAIRLASGDTNKTRKTDIIVRESWARRFELMVSDFLDIEGYIGLKTRSDSALVKQQSSIAKQIDALQLRAESYLERLWKQFSAMEQRVAESQSQAEYLTKISSSSSSSGQ